MKIKLLLIVVMTLAICIPLWAEDPPAAPSTGASGTAIQSIFRAHGTDLVGGFSGGNSSGTYLVEGICVASGGADAFGKAVGEDGTGPSSAWSSSKGFVDASAFGQGGPTTIDLSGFAEQGTNAAVKKDDNNFASGAGYSKGGFEGTIYGSPEAMNLGKGEAVGNTNVSLEETANTRSGWAETNNVSFGNVGGAASTLVYGEGAIGVMATIGGGTSDNFFAGAGANGTGFYNGVGGNYAAGTSKVTGSADVINGVGFISASSSTRSESKLSGGACPGEPCTP